MPQLDNFRFGNVTRLLSGDTLIPCENNLLKRVEDIKVGDKVRIDRLRSIQVIGNQFNESAMDKLTFDYNPSLIIGSDYELTVIDEEGNLKSKLASEITEKDLVMSMVGQLPTKTDAIAYNLGRMTSLNNNINSIVSMSEFIVNNPVQYSISYLQGYLNGSRELIIASSDTYKDMCFTLMNSIAALYSSAGATVQFIEEESQIVDTDVPDPDNRFYLRLSKNKVVMSPEGTRVIVCVDTNKEEWSINPDIETIPVTAYRLRFLSDEEIVIPAQYGLFLTNSIKNLKYRCWNLVQSAFMQGSSDMSLKSFMKEFRMHGAVTDAVLKGLRFSRLKSREVSGELMGYNLTLQGGKPCTYNSFILQGVENAFGINS